MITEIISIGTELLQGATQDTNSTYISRKLLENGIETQYRSTVGDNMDRLVSVLKDAVQRSDFIITTGGLGPTVDDMTVEAGARAFGLTLEKNEQIEQRIRVLYEKIQIPFTEAAMRQAMVPSGAELIRNKMGTAPGVRIKTGGSTLTFMPGVPREMKAMLEEVIAPLISSGNKRVYKSRSLRVFGVGESNLEAKLPVSITTSDNPSFSFLPHRFEVELRLTAHGATIEDCSGILDASGKNIYELVGEYIYGENEDTLHSVVIREMEKRGLTLSAAESVTGGMIGSKLTEIPGSSAVFKGAVVSYAASAKTDVLGIPAEIINRHGTVSEETAREMAERSRALFNTDMSVSVTGNAGPDTDGSGDVGLVYIALAFKDGRDTVCTSKQFKRARNDVRLIAALAALDLVRKNI